MRNLRLDICYDGTRYRGWQRLPGVDNTIQGKLEQCLSRILDETIEVSGSGRTDAGVHARGQVANFHTNSTMSAGEILENLRKSGMNYTEYRDSVRKEITVSAMRGMRYERGIPPTPDEITEEYAATSSEYRDIMHDRITYSKIFIPAADPEDPMVSPEERYKLAVRLREELDAGRISFAAAARQYSRDAQAENGGKWPAMRRDELAVEFANVVFAAKPGQMVGPLLDPAGFTIVKVHQKQLAAAPPLTSPEVKQKVDDAVRRKKSERRYRQWVDRLRDKAVIRTFI